MKGDAMTYAQIVAVLLVFSGLLVVALVYYLRRLASSDHPFRSLSVVDQWFAWIRHRLQPSGGLSAPEATVFQAVSGSDTALRTAAIAGTYTLIAAIVAGAFALATKSLEVGNQLFNEASAPLHASESFAQWRTSPFFRDELPVVRRDAVAACGSPEGPTDAALGTRLSHLLFAASSFGCRVPIFPPEDCRGVKAALQYLTFCEDFAHD
jgi:hypothetical protein